MILSSRFVDFFCLIYLNLSWKSSFLYLRNWSFEFGSSVNYFFSPFRELNDLILMSSSPTPRKLWSLCFWIFDDCFLSLSKVCWCLIRGISYLCHQCFGRETMNVPTASSYPRRFRGLSFSNLLIFRWLCFYFHYRNVFLTSGRRFSPLGCRRFRGLVICITETVEYFVSWSFDELLVVPITHGLVIRETHSWSVIHCYGCRSDYFSDV